MLLHQAIMCITPFHARFAGISSASVAAHQRDSQRIDSPLYTVDKAPGAGAGRGPATAINRPAVEVARLPHLLVPPGQRRLELQQRLYCSIPIMRRTE